MGFVSCSVRKFSPVVLLLLLFATSCTEEKLLLVFNRNSVKNFPADTPFVYNTQIAVESKNVSGDEKQDLLKVLPTYLDDSLQALRAQRFGFFYRIKNPPIFDTSHINRSVSFMTGYLNSIGYYHTAFRDTFYVDTFRNQQRTYITLIVDPGKVTVIDSFSYNLGDSTLQQLATSDNANNNSLIKPGKSHFSKPLLGNELDRLVSLYKNRGYMLISRDNLIAEADTTDPAVLQITADPFEQIRTLQEAEERSKQNPVAQVVIKTRDIGNDSTDLVDSSQLKQYRIGNIYYYPETRYTDLPDSLMVSTDLPVLKRKKEFTMYGSKGLVKIQPLRQHTFMRKGNLYNDRLFLKTMNNLSSIGAWQNVDSRYHIRRTDSLPEESRTAKQDTVDFHFFMVPAVKQNFTVGLEASRNTGDFLTTGNLFGIAVNATYLNRNVWHRAIQSSTSFRNGIELSLNKNIPLLQTFQSSLSHSYSFPNFILPKAVTDVLIKRRERLDGIKTIIGATATYSERRNYFRIRQLVTNWGYEWKLRNKAWAVKIPNIELYSLDTLPNLVKQLQDNPFLRTAFTTGSIISIIGSFNTSYVSDKHPGQNNFFRAAVEEAGGLSGNIHPWNENIYRYVKGEMEYRKLFTITSSSSVVGRIFAGIGYNYGKVGRTLPFYKQFFAGGPNSMRAWSLRQLGLGSSLISDTAGTKTVAFRDRYGDLQLEANLEYRYTIAQFSSLRLAGALFSDVGNVWNVKKDKNNPDSEFDINRLGKDIAIGVGTGIRMDFSYFLIRIDGGLKLKDPARLANNGWLNFSNFTWRNKEFQRTDDNGNVVSPNRNNYAIQLGIGLPF